MGGTRARGLIGSFLVSFPDSSRSDYGLRGSGAFVIELPRSLRPILSKHLEVLCIMYNWRKPYADYLCLPTC